MGCRPGGPKSGGGAAPRKMGTRHDVGPGTIRNQGWDGIVLREYMEGGRTNDEPSWRGLIRANGVLGPPLVMLWVQFSHNLLRGHNGASLWKGPGRERTMKLVLVKGRYWLNVARYGYNCAYVET